MKITITYPDWHKLRERADARLKAGHGADFYMAVAMNGEDVSMAHPDAYSVVYNEELKWDDPQITDHEVLERLFEMFNIGDHGGRRDLRSMSVGDQVTLDDRTYVCKPCGWEKLPA